jgi:glycosyltransferase involved in cell wall biosynthesis
MKLLFCIDHLRSDGTQRALYHITAGLIQRDHRVAILCLNDSFDPQLLDALREAGAYVMIIGKLGLLMGYGLSSILHWMRQEQFDSVVTMLFWSDVIGRILARTAGIPRIFSSIRARNTNYALWQLFLVRATMPMVDVVVLNSRRVSSFAVAGEGVPPERLVYIPNGIDPSLYANPISRPALRTAFGLPENATVIGSVGRLTRQKGFDTLLEALADLRMTNVHLLLAGIGEEKEKLHLQSQHLGIERQVHLVGYRRDVPQWLGALDLYIQPSRFEGAPNALLEAMAAGCPIIATNVDGNSELIIDGEHGWLAPPDRADILAYTINLALTHPLEAQRRGRLARERAVREFSLERMVDQWEEILERCITTTFRRYNIKLSSFGRSNIKSHRGLR